MSETRTYPVRSGNREIKIALYHDPSYIPDLAAEQFAPRMWEPELVHLLFRAIKPGMHVVDAGANIGIFSLIMDKLVGPTGRVDAFEPHPDTCRRLDRNLLLNQSAVIPHEMALWDCRRDLTLHTFRDDPGMNSLKQFDGCAGSRTVRCDRLDALIVQRPDFIKLDIEGAEEKAMRGADTWLPQHPLVACEYAQDHLARFGTTRKNFADYMRGFGYDLWILSPEGEMPTAVSPEFDVQGGTLNLVVLFATKEQVSALWPT